MTSDNFIGQLFVIALLIVVGVFVVVVLIRAIRIIPQASAGIVERLGKYHKTLNPGLNILVPFIDRVRPLIDMREQVVSFPPQPVITEDNLVVSIDTVVYFQVTDARAATYEIANYLGAVEQLTTTTLRNVVGGLNLEEALTSRDNINGQLRVVLDEATGKWGIRVGRVELKAIDPPASIQDSMEKQMRAERDRRALILTAEGTKQSAILTAEGARQSAILNAEGDAQAAVLRANGEAKAITTVFQAIHAGAPDGPLLSYQYLQMLPKLAEGQASKLWIIPSEFTEALKTVGQGFLGGAQGAAVPGHGGVPAGAAFGDGSGERTPPPAPAPEAVPDDLSGDIPLSPEMPLPLPDDLLASTRMTPSELGEVAPGADQPIGAASAAEPDGSEADGAADGHSAAPDIAVDDAALADAAAGAGRAAGDADAAAGSTDAVQSTDGSVPPESR